MSRKLKLLLPGALLGLVGVVLSADFRFAGPTFPDGPVDVLGWLLLLGGLAWMAAVDRLAG
jgi:hypothetical protein